MRKQIVTSWTLRLFLIIRSDQRDLWSFWTVRKLSYLNCTWLNSEYLVNVWICFWHLYTYLMSGPIGVGIKTIYTYLMPSPNGTGIQKLSLFAIVSETIGMMWAKGCMVSDIFCPNSLTQHPSHNHAYTYTHMHMHIYIRKQAPTHSGHIYWDKTEIALPFRVVSVLG